MARTVKSPGAWEVQTLLFAIGIAAWIGLSAANVRDSIESARKTPVVYVGLVSKVSQIERTPTHLLKAATISVSFIARGDGDALQANFPYLSYDDRTGPMDGPPQYVLAPGTWVLVFATTFDGIRSREGPYYMRQGSRDELEKVTTSLAQNLGRMTPHDLEDNEISESDRATQTSMYQQLLDYFHSPSH